MAIVQNVTLAPSIKYRLLDFGLQKGCTIQYISRAPSGSPCAFLLHGVVVAIRTSDCKSIFILKTKKGEFPLNQHIM